MRKLLYIFMLFVLAQVVGSCMPGDKTVILQTAEAVLYEQPDSALKLLSQIEYPKTLPHSQLMRYGWIQAYAHYACGISMSREDSLILPAADYFSAQGDSAKLPGIYLAKAVYYQWKQQYGKMETALDTAYLIASRQQDSMALFNLYNYKGYIYTQLKKDHAHGAKYLKEALRYHQEPDIYFSLGICLALDGIKRHATPSQTDSASYYMNKAIEWALSKEDTVRACHYMRNYAQILTSYRRSQEAIELAKRTLPLTTHGQHHKVLLYSCIGENYLKEGNLDSAQHYITLANKENPTFVTTKNAVAQYQMINQKYYWRKKDCKRASRSSTRRWCY